MTMAWRKREQIVSETQHGPVATDAAGPDAETGEADDVSEYSEEATGLDPAGEAADAASADGVSEDDPGLEADVEEEEKPDDAREEFERELRMLPGDWYVVHSYAGYENRVKTNLESRIQSLNMEDYIFQIEVPVHQVTEIKGGKRQQVQEKVLPGYILVRMDLTDESWAVVRNTPGVTGFVGLSSRPSPLQLGEVASLLAPEPEPGT
jgi:transcriptional antiterminator NusG